MNFFTGLYRISKPFAIKHNPILPIVPHESPCQFIHSTSSLCKVGVFAYHHSYGIKEGQTYIGFHNPRPSFFPSPISSSSSPHFYPIPLLSPLYSFPPFPYLSCIFHIHAILDLDSHLK